MIQRQAQGTRRKAPVIADALARQARQTNRAYKIKAQPGELLR